MSTPGRFVLDTSIVIAHFRNDQTVTDKLLESSLLLLPAIALGELYTGAYRKETNQDKAIKTVEDFLGLVQVLRPDTITAKLYGQLRADLMTKGTPIPDNDLWIAALAVQYGLPLANRDGHFDCIESLEQEKWTV